MTREVQEKGHEFARAPPSSPPSGQEMQEEDEDEDEEELGEDDEDDEDDEDWDSPVHASQSVPRRSASPADSVSDSESEDTPATVQTLSLIHI